MILLNFALALINGFTKLFLVPVLNFLGVLLGDYSATYSFTIVQLTATINTVITQFIVPGMVWIVNLIPPLTYQVCLMFLGLWLLMWEFELTVGLILHVLTWIKKYIPFA